MLLPAASWRVGGRATGLVSGRATALVLYAGAPRVFAFSRLPALLARGVFRRRGECRPVMGGLASGLADRGPVVAVRLSFSRGSLGGSAWRWRCALFRLPALLPGGALSARWQRNAIVGGLAGRAAHRPAAFRSGRGGIDGVMHGVANAFAMLALTETDSVQHVVHGTGEGNRATACGAGADTSAR